MKAGFFFVIFRLYSNLARELLFRTLKSNSLGIEMKLTKFSYAEYKGKPEEWFLDNANFEKINLIVGKNGSGKSRLLNVINSLALLLSGRRRKLFATANYHAEFQSDNNTIYRYELLIENSIVVKEYLTEDERVLLNRGVEGTGILEAIDLGQPIKFQVPESELVAVTRLDKIQHPYFSDLNKWAKSVKHYKFGAELGKNLIIVLGGAEEDKLSETEDFLLDQERVTAILKLGMEKYGNQITDAILRDFNDVGYDCSDMGLMTSQDIHVQGQPAAVLYVKENDLEGVTQQHQMSQGMFRAFSLLIQLNYSILSNLYTTILIDDIGEGLDFERSSNLISKIIKISEENNFDLIMTTNDRFVMNKVPLDYWSIIHRIGNRVRLINKKNSKEVFDKFEYVGLNNFDFFSSEFYLGKDSD